MTGVTVTQQQTVTIIDARNKPVDHIRVTFMVDDDGPFYRTFTMEEFNGFGARAQLDAFAREVRTLRGQV